MTKNDSNVEPQHKRLGKDEYFMEIAKIVAKRSTCLRRDVGAVLVKDAHIISTGYNGTPAGLPHCTPSTCVRTKLNIPSGKDPHLCRAVHAELNCIIQAARHGTSIDGNTTIYVTAFPCIDCTKVLINAGIKRIVYLGEYDSSNEIRNSLIAESGIVLEKYSPEGGH
ncbi:MAG: dCMP deaminase family protein [Candidatus Lokiarchaeota archaeon]|nr:dCMP deaminase family protein [Candidatus Lokiarchaeota archaeon]